VIPSIIAFFIADLYIYFFQIILPKDSMAKYILSRVLVITDGVLDSMIGFIAPYTFTQLGTTGNTALSPFYTLSSSPLHTH
jgi:hypothetical protein